MLNEEKQRIQDEFDIEKKNIVKKVKKYGTAVAITIAASTLGVKAKNLYEIN